MAADEIGPVGWRCRKHGGGNICNIANCGKISIRTTNLADDLGPAGHRCTAHTGSVCNVIGCTLYSVTTVPEADNLGEPGLRCQKHGKICVVTDCTRIGVRKLPEDSIGRDGYRCHHHGGAYACCASGCMSIGRHLIRAPDRFGPAGFRCSAHGRRCEVDGCEKVGKGKCKADDLGPSAWRCVLHGYGAKQKKDGKK